MKTSTRLLIVAGCFLLCASGFIRAGISRTFSSASYADVSDDRNFPGEYQYAANDPTTEQIKAILRYRPQPLEAREPYPRLEFGPPKKEMGKISVQVTYFTFEGKARPYLYVLVPEKNSWKVENVRRLWLILPSHLLRGLRV
ncbi:MAG TPA: hypothetical protein VJ063_21645 [Verrucomicrobiae bacterium]|nr:hypothetical protein [Verrucomicrobiae bacterium]